jgi:hypothetical protein
MTSANGKEGAEKADSPYSHDDNPCNDKRPEVLSAEDLEVEKRDGGFDESDGENAGDNEGIVVLGAH